MSSESDTSSQNSDDSEIEKLCTLVNVKYKPTQRRTVTRQPAHNEKTARITSTHSLIQQPEQCEQIVVSDTLHSGVNSMNGIDITGDFEVVETTVDIECTRISNEQNNIVILDKLPPDDPSDDMNNKQKKAQNNHTRRYIITNRKYISRRNSKPEEETK